jgi:probable O-glycosylation ligase (exosortase A-associated)
MGLRDIALVIILAGLIPVALKRPWIGALGWVWVSAMAPHRLAWGFAHNLPIALMVGGATLIGFLFTKDRKPLPKSPIVLLMALFAVHFTLTTLFAINPARAWGKWSWVSKAYFMTFIIMILFQDRRRLRWLYTVIALSVGFYGVKGGLWVLRTGGGERVFGPAGTFFADNNEMGLALCMVLPMLLTLAREEENRWMKRLFAVTAGFSVLAALFTYSRGAFLALAVILAILIWRSPWRGRIAVALLVGTLVAVPLLPQRLWDRMASIDDQMAADTRDTSARGRIEAWTTGFNMALSRPLNGGGFRAYNTPEVWLRYHPTPFLKVRDVHSLYFEVLGEHGFVGAAIYFSILLAALATLRRIRKRWRDDPEHGYLSRYAEMSQMVVAPYLVAGAFLGLAYFDLYLFFLAGTAVLHSLSAKAEAAVAPARTRLSPARRALPVPIPGALPRRRPLPPSGSRA